MTLVRILAVFLAVQAQAPQLGPGERLVVSIPVQPGVTWSILSISPDGTAAAWTETRAGKPSVAWNNGRIDDLDKVEPFCAWKEKTTPVFKVWKNGKVSVTNGAALHEGFDSIGDPILSPTRKSVAYVAREKSKKVFVATLDYKFEVLNVQDSTLAFSPADELFYVGTISTVNGPMVVSFLGKESKELKGYLGSGLAGPVGFAPDGTIAYTLLGKGTVQTTAGFTGPSFDRAYSLRFSEDGQVLAYFVEVPAGGGKVKKQLCVAGVANGPKYDDIVGYPGLSRDGKTVAYVAKKGSKWVVAQGTKFSDEYEMIRPKVGDVDQPVVSGDGRTVAFVAEKQGKSVLVVNSRAMAEENYISAPVLNFSGSTVTYGFISGQNVIWKTVAIPGR